MMVAGLPPPISLKDDAGSNGPQNVSHSAAVFDSAVNSAAWRTPRTALAAGCFPNYCIIRWTPVNPSSGVFLLFLAFFLAQIALTAFLHQTQRNPVFYSITNSVRTQALF